MDDLSDNALESFVNNQLNEYKEFAGFFNPNDTDLNVNQNNKETTTDNSDFTKASNNDLLEEDLEV